MDIDNATLKVTVNLDGVDAATQKLGALGAAGDASATKVGAAFQQNVRSAQALETQMNTLTQITAGWAGASNVAKDIAIQMSAGLAQQGAMANATAQQIQQLADAQRIMSGESVKATEAIAAQAVATDAFTASTGEATVAASTFELQGLGRIRQGMTSLLASVTGTVPVIDRLGASLAGGFGVGTIAIIGAVAGVVALVEIYKAWDEESAKAKDEQDKLTESLTKWYDKQKEGAAGEFPKEIEAMTTKLIALHKEMDAIMAGKFFTDVSAVGQGGSRVMAWVRILTSGDPVAAFAQYEAEVLKGAGQVAKAIATGGDAIAAAHAEVAKKINDEIVKEQRARLDNLKASDLSTPMDLATQRVTKALMEQQTELAKATDASNAYSKAADDQTRLVGLLGVAHELTAARIRAENEQIAANKQFADDPSALAIVTDAIQKSYDQAKANILMTATIKDQADAQKMLNDDMKGLPAVATGNIKATQQQADAYANLSKIVSQDLLKAIEQFTQGGTISWSSFFRAAESASSHMVQQLSSDIDAMARKEAEALKAHETAQAQKYATDIVQYQQYLKDVQALGAAVAGGVVGYSIGQQSGSSAIGVLGGAAGGAAAGSAILPGLGTAVGALTGAAAGLLGAANAQGSAADKLRAAADALQQNVQSYVDSTKTGVDAQLAQETTRYQTIQTALQAAFDANVIDANTYLAESKAAGDAFAVLTQRITDAANAAQQASQQDYYLRQITAQASGGSVADQNDVALQTLEVKQARELAAAINAGGSPATIAALQAALDAEKQQELAREDAAIAADKAQQAAAQAQAAADDAAARQQLIVDGINDQISLAQQQLQVVQASLQAQQQAVNATKQVVDALKTFSDSLLTGPLSALSPIDQLNAAKAQRDTLFSAARGGDQNAASQYGAAAQTYLQLAQGYYASSPGYVSAFASTQSQAGQLSDQFGQQLDVQQQILATLQASNDKLSAQIALLQSQLDQTKQSRVDQLVSQANLGNVTEINAQLHALGYQLVQGLTQLSNGNATPNGIFTRSLYDGPGSPGYAPPLPQDDGPPPGFASGGDFRGGLRLVGERGPELESTGPSRITNTNSLMAALTASGAANAELLTEIRALREDVKNGTTAGVRVSAEAARQTVQRLDSLIDTTTQAGKKTALRLDGLGARAS